MKLAIFDFNGTLMEKETLPFLLSQWGKQGYSKLKMLRVNLPLIPLYLKYKLQSSDSEKFEIMAVKKFSKIFAGLTKEELEAFFTEAFNNSLNYINNTAVREIHDTNHQDYHTVLLSGAYENLLEKYARAYDINTVIGTKLYFTAGKVDPAKPPDIISGSCKLEKLMNNFSSYSINWSRSRAYADSYNDLPLLKKVGIPVPVNPDEKLYNYARSRNWPSLTER